MEISQVDAHSLPVQLQYCMDAEVSISSFRGANKEAMGHDIRALCEWKEVLVLELNVQPDHVHLVCSILPKLSVSEFIGFLGGQAGDKVV